MSNFTNAAQALGLPVCPHCEEMYRIDLLVREPTRQRWRCDHCSRPFTVIVVAGADARVSDGAFKVPL